METEEKFNKLFGDVETVEVIPLDEGKYTGKITKIDRDTEHFDYIRYNVELDIEEEMNLQLSFPTKISYTNDGKPSSQHCKFLDSMKLDFKKPYIELAKSLIDLKISFLVENVTNDKGTFSQIVKTSVKLV